MAKNNKKIEKLLDSFLAHNMNVLFEGRHGVGKSAMVRACFEKNGLKWQYFSAATMDPWVDFVGVPKAVKNEQGKEVLDFVLPPLFADDSIEALFFDEINRAPKKVRNAVMELIQFKSINGRKFKNLKVVWAAINPIEDVDGAEYDVERLDPAFIDRFHAHITLPYDVDDEYFKDKFSQYGERACAWWRALPPNIKALVSPRRLEYAVEAFAAYGHAIGVLPKETKPSSFISALKKGSIIEQVRVADDSTLDSLLRAGEVRQEYQTYLMNNNSHNLEDLRGLPFLTGEELTKIVEKHDSVFKYVMSNSAKVPAFKLFINNVANLPNGTLKKKFLDFVIEGVNVEPRNNIEQEIVNLLTRMDGAPSRTNKWKAAEDLNHLLLTNEASHSEISADLLERCAYTLQTLYIRYKNITTTEANIYAALKESIDRMFIATPNEIL